MKALTALLALASAVNAHMIMKTPIPAGSPDNSPLNADGSNFPCKTGPGTIDTSKPNVMTIGSPNTLSFTGSATHGGGSCQVSLAKGTTVDKNTKWMVIHSIEGGCPAGNNGNQNIGDDPAGTGASQFQFTVPNHPDLAAGDYTLAWTWHNRIGNREMYMNCAYVQLGGAAKKRYAPSTPPMSKRQSSSLPAMFQANIGNGCTTTEGTDVKYPDPGQSLELGPGGNLAAPVGSCGASGAAPANPSSDGPSGPSSSAFGGAPVSSAFGSGPSSSAFGGGPAVSNTVAPVPSATGGSGGSASRGGNPNNGQYTQTGGGVFATVGGPDATASPIATETSAAGNPVATGSPNNGQYTQSAGGVFAGGAASQSAPASAPAASAVSSAAPVVTPPSAPQAPASSAPAAPVGTSAPSTPVTSGLTTAGTPCEQEGAWACAADGKSFQRCASERWSASIQMSAGMSCVPGVSANFAYNASIGNGAKRDMKSHIAKRRHNMHSPSFP